MTSIGRKWSTVHSSEPTLSSIPIKRLLPSAIAAIIGGLLVGFLSLAFFQSVDWSISGVPSELTSLGSSFYFLGGWMLGGAGALCFATFVSLRVSPPWSIPIVLLLSPFVSLAVGVIGLVAYCVLCFGGAAMPGFYRPI